MEIKSLAAVIINSCENVSNKKLQKLSYYVYSWYLTLFDMEIARMDFEAWEHGPVCRRLYNMYRKYGWNPIPRMEDNFLVSSERMKLISAVLKVYGEFSADELEEMTHKEAPWQIVRDGLKHNEPSDAIISKDIIKDYYNQQNIIKEKIIAYMGDVA